MCVVRVLFALESLSNGFIVLFAFDSIIVVNIAQQSGLSNITWKF